MNTSQRVSAAALLCATVLILVDSISGNHLAAIPALAFVILHVATSWQLVRTGSRIMAVLAILVAGIFVTFDGTFAELALAASRALYLPALLAVMTLLRVAAQRSAQVQVAAHFVVSRPPQRRYWLLAAGGQIFGILLNVGGLQFLMRIALAGSAAQKEDERVAEIRTRRIANAVLRGFTATVLWSPVGIAMNLILPLMPTIAWIDYVPYGLGLLIVFLIIGWIFDRIGSPPTRRSAAARQEGAISALVMLIGIVVAITGLAALGELVSGVSLRASILVVVPLVAGIWMLTTSYSAPFRSLADFGADSFRALPSSVSEICMIGATGFLGLLIAEMIPPDSVKALIAVLDVGPGVIACSIVLLMTGLSMVGINPLITGTAVVGAIISAEVAIPEPMLMAAALSGWTSAMTISPVTVTIAIAASATGKDSGTVGLRWNGLFTLVFLCVVSGALLIWGTLI